MNTGLRFLAFCLGLQACSGDPGSSPVDAGSEIPTPAFPDSFLDNYLELRDCRHSHEHELRRIRVFADPLAAPSYRALTSSVPYPEGATLVKLEYEFEGCNYSDFLQYTVLKKMEPGFNPETNDWLWQRVSAKREVLEEGAMSRCVNCHTVHCAPPHGYDLTCAEEI